MKLNVVNMLFAFLPFLFTSCYEDEKFLWSLINQSKESIYIIGGIDEVNTSNWKQSNLREVRPDSIFSSWVYEDDLESRSLVLYLFRKSTIELYSWEQIKEKCLYDKKIICSYSDLRKVGNLIVFKEESWELMGVD